MIVSRHQNQKSINKLVEEAEYSGELHLRNRKLKDVSLCFSDYNLSDVTIADLSHNSLNDIPLDIYEWHCLHVCNLSYNNIKQIPSILTHFSFIEVLDLGNNLITHLPSSICDLRTLVVLLLKSNKLVSIPSAIGKLQNCQKLDISGNQLNNIPSEIGSMSALKHLDLSRNCLYTLPEEIANLDLVYFNTSGNRISSIPTSFQEMKELENANFSDNPLTSPPLAVLKKGRIHMFKLMQSESAKTKRQQEIMEPLLARKRDKHLNKVLDFSLEGVVQSMQKQGLGESNGILIAANTLPSSNHSSPIKSPTETKVENGYAENVASSPVHEAQVVFNAVAVESNEANGTSTEDPAEVTTNDNASSKVCENTSVVDGPEKVENKNRSKPLSPIKENSVHSGIPIPKKHVPEKKPAAKVIGFPGYAPPPIKEKPKKRRSHLHGDVADQTHYLEVIKPRTAVLSRKGKSESENDMSFTMRRKTEKIYEELEQLEDLRHCIESALKLPLPQDLLPSLSDGVVLCHLANHVKNRSIPTIHVPSPAVPKLSLAKCRRNVDNFLDACSKLGVPQSKLCSSADIMHGKGLSRIVSTVTDLLKLTNQNGVKREPSFSTPTVRIAPSLQQQK